MHEPVRSRLEEYLRDGEFNGGSAFSDVEAHLAACRNCSEEVGAMRAQAALFRALRTPAPVELRRDLYAGILNRIEAQTARPSVWTLFADSLFARRLAWGAASALFLLGSYLVTPDNPANSRGEIVAGNHSNPELILAGDRSELPPPIEVHPNGRGAVLVSLASWDQ